MVGRAARGQGKRKAGVDARRSRKPAAPNQDEAAAKANAFADMFASSRIDAASPSPRYFQVYTAIREKILAGILRNGDRLPSEAEIGDLFGVSRITARRAVAELVATGLARSSRGQATTASFQGSQQRQRGSMEDLLENLLILGDRTSVTVAEFGYVAATGQVAAALEIPAGNEVQRALRIRHEDGQPLSLIETFVPAEIGHRFEMRDLEQISLQAIFRRLGINVTRAEQSFSACAVLGHDAQLLGVPAGSPAFRISRIVFDEVGRPVEYVTALYRGDRYEYQMSLVRSEGRWTRR